MTDSLLKRYTTSNGRTHFPAPLPTSAATHPADETTEEADDCGAFGYLRGVRDRAIMLELRKKDGNIKALGYAWLAQIDYDPSHGITLHFGGQKVSIKGQNLNGPPRQSPHSTSDTPSSLLEALCCHRVTWIQESNTASLMDNVTRDCAIESVVW